MKKLFFFSLVFNSFIIITLVLLSLDNILNQINNFSSKYLAFAIENINTNKENSLNNLIDNKPPLIEFVTTELKEGKNVFRIKINDESALKFSEINYLKNGEIKIESLVHDKNDIYKALISVHPPSIVLVINAGDIYGNKASFSQTIKVNPRSDMFTEIIQYFSDIFKG